MGTCCNAHLVTKVREYAPNAQNGAVTVTLTERTRTGGFTCDYCKAPAEFIVSYYPKPSVVVENTVPEPYQPDTKSFITLLPTEKDLQTQAFWKTHRDD